MQYVTCLTYNTTYHTWHLSYGIMVLWLSTKAWVSHWRKYNLDECTIIKALISWIISIQCKFWGKLAATNLSIEQTSDIWHSIPQHCESISKVSVTCTVYLLLFESTCWVQLELTCTVHLLLSESTCWVQLELSIIYKVFNCQKLEHRIIHFVRPAQTQPSTKHPKGRSKSLFALLVD